MTTSSINSFLAHHRLELSLTPILVGELYLISKLKHPVYVIRDGLFVTVLAAGSGPVKEQINLLLKNGYRDVYIFRDDFEEIRKNLESALIKVNRSLSVGDPIENGTKNLKLLSLNLGGIYKDPHNDESLMGQFQSSQNLSKFLLENRKTHSILFQNLSKENFHFTLSQPMLSSLLLLSFLQSTHLFHEREIENLFLASYLKDIGFSMIPEEKYDIKNLNGKDQALFANHADFSFELLEGRIPLAKNYLTIIRHHHFLNEKMKRLLAKEVTSKNNDSEIILGLESTLIAVFDILVAMTHDRPYRKGMTIFQSMEIIKKLMADDYPQEFKALVFFLKQFYKN
ncbi:MAG: HD-GYP domain-containing protein [Bacteriovoracaceae bacterium]